MAPAIIFQRDLPESATADPFETGRDARKRGFRVDGQIVAGHCNSSLGRSRRRTPLLGGLATNNPCVCACLDLAGLPHETHDHPQRLFHLRRMRSKHRASSRQIQKGLACSYCGDQVRREFEKGQIPVPTQSTRCPPIVSGEIPIYRDGERGTAAASSARPNLSPASVRSRRDRQSGCSAFLQARPACQSRPRSTGCFGCSGEDDE